jgi:hypothetical protein
MPEADDGMTHKPDAGGSNDAMTEQGVLFMQEPVCSLIDPPAAVPPPPPPPAMQTAMRNRLHAYRANDPAAYEKPTKKTK